MGEFLELVPSVPLQSRHNLHLRNMLFFAARLARRGFFPFFVELGDNGTPGPPISTSKPFCRFSISEKERLSSESAINLEKAFDYTHLGPEHNVGERL